MLSHFCVLYNIGAWLYSYTYEYPVFPSIIYLRNHLFLAAYPWHSSENSVDHMCVNLYLSSRHYVSLPILLVSFQHHILYILLEWLLEIYCFPLVLCFLDFFIFI